MKIKEAIDWLEDLKSLQNPELANVDDFYGNDPFYCEAIDIAIKKLKEENVVTLPNNATIGDVITTLFPDLEWNEVEVYDNKFIECYWSQINDIRLDLDIWNAQFKLKEEN